MSDHDAAPDPMDKAYAQAEAVLGDEAARAARRARVLAAVARAPAEPPAESAPAMRRPAWRRGGWLAAASVGGLSLYLAAQVYRPAPTPPQPQTAPAAPAVVPATPAQGVAAPATPAARTPQPAPRAPARAPRVATSSSPGVSAVAPPPPPASSSEVVVTGARREPAEMASSRARPPGGGPADQAADADVLERRALKATPNPSFAPAAPPAARAAAPSSSQSVQELVVTSGRQAREAPPAAVSSKASPSERAARLRDAAAAGRVTEVKALLAKDVPVDAADDDGETALMKAVQADQPAAAALLRRHGASPDRQNRAGASARDMARSIGDPELDQALGVAR
jgi:hypothetical protein